MSVQDLYSDKVMDHFFNPRNMGEIKNPNAVARVGNPVCGDVMEIAIKVGSRAACEDKSQAPPHPPTAGKTSEVSADLTSEVKEAASPATKVKYIKDIKFKTLGCGAAIATSSIATEMVKGKSLEEAEKITNKAVTEALGGLPSAKTHCSVLAADAIKKAIGEYKKRRC